MTELKKRLKFFAAVLLSLILLSSCVEKPGSVPQETQMPTDTEEAYMDEIAQAALRDELFEGKIAEDAREAFLTFIMESFGTEALLNICRTSDKADWHRATGNTLNVLSDMFNGYLDPQSPAYRRDISRRDVGEDTVIRVVGDIGLGEDWHISPRIDSRGQGIGGVVDSDVLSLLTGADITLANNEFCFSERGRKMAGKMYTFRAKPSRVGHLADMGIDIVSLANNHVYDFGAEAFSDTLATLDGAMIARIGAGENKVEAGAPHYFIAGGRKIAFTAATRAEKNIMTPEATETSSGVMRTYDPADYLEVIKRAESECDINIVYVHWSREGSHYYEKELRELAVQYIEAGADIIIGAHAHQLQGMEMINGVPVVYNLGDFLFDLEFVETGILEINIGSAGEMSYRFIPCYQENVCVHLAKGKIKSDILDLMRTLSVNIVFSNDGTLSMLP